MPAFGRDGILKPEEIRQVASYVRTLSKLEPEAGVDVAAGKKSSSTIARCATATTPRAAWRWAPPTSPTACNSMAGTSKTCSRTIGYARNSTMPAWGARLDPVTIKSLTVFVHSLGAGQ